MKKALWVGSALLLATGWGFQPLFLTANAQPSSPATAAPDPSATPAGVIAKPALNPALNPASQPVAKPALKRPTITLLSTGAEPRQVLRFKPTVNTKQIATMTLNMDMGITVAGTEVPRPKMPATVITFETLVNQIDPNGDIHYQFQYANVDVTGESSLNSTELAELKTQMQKMKGMSGTVVINNRGQTQAAQFNLPPNLDPTVGKMLKQMSQSVEQFSAPMPEPAIGLGAKWQVATSPKINGISLQQTTTFELVSIQNGTATLSVAFTQQAQPQSVGSPELPKDMMMNLKSLTGSGQGQVMVQFDRLISPKSTLTLHSSSEMALSQTDGSNPMGMKMDSNINMTMEGR